MNPTSEYSNVPWALRHAYSPDDATRDEARLILIELGLAEPGEFAAPEPEERAVVRTIARRAVDAAPWLREDDTLGKILGKKTE